MNASDVLVETLMDWGVDTIFGLPGRNGRHKSRIISQQFQRGTVFAFNLLQAALARRLVSTPA